MLKSTLLIWVSVLVVYFFACGDLESVKVLPPDISPINNPIDPGPIINPGPIDPDPNDPDPITSYSEVAAIMEGSCLGAACHSAPGVKGVDLDTELGLRFHYNKAMQTIQTNRMPVGKPPLSAIEIQMLRDWFDGTP